MVTYLYMGIEVAWKALCSGLCVYSIFFWCLGSFRMSRVICFLVSMISDIICHLRFGSMLVCHPVSIKMSGYDSFVPSSVGLGSWGLRRAKTRSVGAKWAWGTGISKSNREVCALEHGEFRNRIVVLKMCVH